MQKYFPNANPIKTSLDGRQIRFTHSGKYAIVLLTGTRPLEIERRQIGVFFVCSAVIDRANTKKRRDGAFQL